MFSKTALIACASALFITGCASVAVNDAALAQRTSLALGLTSDQFTISNRVDSGVRTDYSVQTAAGENYACYVTGIISVTGRVVSDAICTGMQSGGNAGQAAPAAAATPNCNDLLRAAGRCE